MAAARPALTHCSYKDSTKRRMLHVMFGVAEIETNRPFDYSDLVISSYRLFHMFYRSGSFVKGCCGIRRRLEFTVPPYYRLDAHPIDSLSSC